MIDLTLDRLKRPAITGLVPNFGTTVEVTEKNKGGLSTTEVDANMALAYELQREVNVSTSDTTSIVEHDAKVALIGDEAITLTLQGASYGGCELKITNRGSQTATILYNEGASIQIPPRGYLRFIWTLQDWWVEQRRNPQEDGGNIQTFTYVVDSDQALIDWANNDRNSGQDYTSVLIKRGTWNSTIGVNLTATGTKVVVGEAGSKLVFNNVEKGLYYDTVPTQPDYYMRDVAVEATGTGDGYGFYNCSNLFNCTGTGTGDGTGDGSGTGTGEGYGFHSCSNLSNCTGTGTGTGTSNGYGYGTGTGYGFHSCSNLSNCTGTGTGDGTGDGSGTGTGEGYGFHSCSNLSNCTGTGTGTGTSNGYGYGTGTGYGFHSCSNLSNCTGTGTGDGTGDGTGYGFFLCTTVIGCKAGGKCTTKVFDNCYASNAKTTTYACADTANGGFNNTTNPSA